MRNIIRVSKANDRELPFRAQTFYKWHHVHKHPELFIKCGKSLFLDLDRLDEILEAGRLVKSLKS